MLLANQFAIQMCRELGLPLFPGFSERAAKRCSATAGRGIFVN
jgi:transcriptional regulator with AAA-type ATPase domain